MEDLFVPYSDVAGVCFNYDHDRPAAERWLALLAEHARQHHDLKALVILGLQRGRLLRVSGEYPAAVASLRGALELCARIGEAALRLTSLGVLRQVYLEMGELAEAEAAGRAVLETGLSGLRSSDALVGFAYAFLGAVRLCQGDRPAALEALEHLKSLGLRIMPGDRAGVLAARGRLALALGRRTQAQADFAAALGEVSSSDSTLLRWAISRPTLPGVLAGLEETCAGPDEFRALSQPQRGRHPAAVTGLEDWALEPAPTLPAPLSPVLAWDDRAAGWIWLDPYGDCACERVGQDLVIRAANGRDLYMINTSAPRLTRTMSGDFTAEVLCAAFDDRPAMGGLLLWLDSRNYLLLERGLGGPAEVRLAGCLANRDLVLGRGRLPARRTWLRLARRGPYVTAYCSADGEAWYTVGRATFPEADPVALGPCVLGAIDRTIYPGTYSAGAAMRFSALRAG